jgi:hypothetical protein
MRTEEARLTISRKLFSFETNLPQSTAMPAGILFETAEIQDSYIAIIHRNQPQVFEPAKSARYHVSYGSDTTRDFMVGEVQTKCNVNLSGRSRFRKEKECKSLANLMQR